MRVISVLLENLQRQDGDDRAGHGQAEEGGQQAALSRPLLFAAAGLLHEIRGRLGACLKPRLLRFRPGGQGTEIGSQQKEKSNDLQNRYAPEMLVWR